VQDYQRAELHAVGANRVGRDVQRPVGELQHPGALLGARRLRALHCRREAGGGVGQLAGAVAEAQRVDALALQDAVEIALHAQLGAARLAQQLDQRLLRRLRDHRAARVEVAHEPLEGKAVHQRHHRISDRREGKRQGHDEA
jgi:hypothetical protein